MIKINLLPEYIVERRRVKVWIAGLAVLLILEVLILAAYVWGPLPFSLNQRLAKAEKRESDAIAAALEVEAIETETAQVRSRFAAKNSWVRWVNEADKLPAEWVDYLNSINDTIPADVVIHGLQLPSGGVLNLSGSTSDMMAALRWYLNMLRCDIVQPGLQSVQFNPGAQAVTTGGITDPMAMSVSMTVALKPQAYSVVGRVPAPPAGIAGGATARGRGGGGRMGGSPGAGGRGGGMRGGRGGGMRGGGMRGGGMRGGGMRGGGMRGGM